MRGRHFGFLGTLCTVWIASRIGFLSVLPAASGQIASLKPSSRDQAVSVENKITAAETELAVIDCCERPFAVLSLRRAGFRPSLIVTSSNPQTVTPPALPFLFEAAARAPSHLALWPAPAPPTPSSAFDFYVYRFHRGGSQAGVLDGGGQYGGSQSGFVATYALADGGALAVLVRGAIAHERLSERELAAGLRLRPFQGLPVSITAERRFRNDRRDAFAVYLAGGKSGVALPLRFKAEGFAQAGVISDKRSGAFFDFAARADRKLLEVGKLPIMAGTGIWGGGQMNGGGADVFRIDAGPTIAAEIPLDEMRLRVSADWRFRIAGDAHPASGPALTLSTSF